MLRYTNTYTIISIVMMSAALCILLYATAVSLHRTLKLRFK